MTPSRYQLALYEAMEHGTGNLAVCARAGSGKSTSLEGGCRRINPRFSVRVVAFNRHIAKPMAERLRDLRNVEVRTTHSASFEAVTAAFGRVKVDDSKYFTLCREASDKARFSGCFPFDRELHPDTVEALSAGKPAVALRQLCDLARMTLSPVTPSGLYDLAANYDIDVDPDAWEFFERAVPLILDYGRELAPETVDYTDMIWLAATDRRVRCRQFDMVLVDEAQDLAAASLEAIARMLKPTGRLVAVGDDRQACYAFAGADPGSFQRIVARFACEILPLSICYRCPTSHLDLAREIVPDIEARPDAPLGEVATLTEVQLRERLQPDDLIICRLTAPVVKLAYELIRNGITAKVRGRDIGKGLVNLVRKVEKRRGFTFGEFARHLNDWADREAEKLIKRAGDDRDCDAVQALEDKVESVRVLYEQCEPASVEDLVAGIENVFSDDRVACTLSTIHRAKGLEADRVFFLGPEKCPLPWARKPAQIEQEHNLRYIALTRAKHSLFLVPLPEDDKPKKKDKP